MQICHSQVFCLFEFHLTDFFIFFLLNFQLKLFLRQLKIVVRKWTKNTSKFDKKKYRLLRSSLKMFGVSLLDECI